MSTTQNAESSPEAGAGSSAPAGAGPANTGGDGGQNNPPSGSAPEAAGGDGAAGQNADDKLSPTERALKNAQAKVAAKKAAAKKDESTTPGSEEQAAGEAGASTPGEPGDDATKKTGEDTTGSGETTPESTVAAPDDWPKEQAEKFAALPSDEARSIVLGFHKEMQGAFTNAMQTLAQERADNRELFDMQARFQNDPKAVLTELAQQAGIEEIFFEKPLPEGEVPEFENQADMIRYAVNKAKEELRGETAKAQSESEQKAAAEAATRQLTEEMEQATKDHTDFADHRPKVIEHLTANPQLSVEDAYRLATYDAIVQMATDGNTSKAELEKVTKELEAIKANSGTPPRNRDTGNGQEKDGLEHLSAGERAYARAQRGQAGRMAARS